MDSLKKEVVGTQEGAKSGLVAETGDLANTANQAVRDLDLLDIMVLTGIPCISTQNEVLGQKAAQVWPVGSQSRRLTF